MRSTTTMSLFARSLFALLILALLACINLYFSGNWYAIGHGYSLAMLFGIISYTLFCCTLVLSTRVRFLDKQFGHDKILRIHGYIATVAIVTGSIHLILKIGYLESITFQTAFGSIGLALILTCAAITFACMTGSFLSAIAFISRIRLFVYERCAFDYSRAKLFHNGFGLAVALLILHVVFASSTQESLLRIVFMGGLGGVVLSRYFYHKVIRPIVNLSRGFYLVNVEKPASKIVRLTFATDRGQQFKFLPGQFAYLRIKAPETGNEEHPFSFSSSPTEENLQMTIKNIGNYTSLLENVKEGTPVIIDGPYGIFTPLADGRDKVFIAGGIGITPFLSTLSSWQTLEHAPKTALFWSATNEEDLIDRMFLTQMAKACPWFTFIPTLTQERSNKYRHGRITPAIIAETISFENVLTTDFYLCGPVPMLHTVQQFLKSNGVPKRNIHFELFSS